MIIKTSSYGDNIIDVGVSIKDLGFALIFPHFLGFVIPINHCITPIFEESIIILGRYEFVSFFLIGSASSLAASILFFLGGSNSGKR